MYLRRTRTTVPFSPDLGMRCLRRVSRLCEGQVLFGALSFRVVELVVDNAPQSDCTAVDSTLSTTGAWGAVKNQSWPGAAIVVERENCDGLDSRIGGEGEPQMSQAKTEEGTREPKVSELGGEERRVGIRRGRRGRRGDDVGECLVDEAYKSESDDERVGEWEKVEKQQGEKRKNKKSGREGKFKIKDKNTMGRKAQTQRRQAKTGKRCKLDVRREGWMGGWLDGWTDSLRRQRKGTLGTMI